VGSGGEGAAVTTLSATFVFFFFLPCPGILPGPACDRAREVRLAGVLVRRLLRLDNDDDDDGGPLLRKSMLQCEA